MSSPALLRVTACMEALADIRQFVKETGEQLGAETEAVTELLCAVDEAATNTVMHGDCEGTETITVEMARQGDNLVVQLTDHARSYDPTATPPPDLTVIPWEREGGLGVYLLRKFTNQVIYSVGRDGSNKLTLVKLAPSRRASL